MCAIVYHDPLRHPAYIHSSFIHSQGIVVYYGTHFRFITKTNSISFNMKTNSISISFNIKTNSISFYIKTNSISISFNMKINSISNFNFILKTNSISNFNFNFIMKKIQFQFYYEKKFNFIMKTNFNFNLLKFFEWHSWATMQALKGCSPQVEVKSRKIKENGISPTNGKPHSSNGGNPYTKTNLYTGCFRKIAKKRGTQIASCAHIYMAF